MPTAYITHPDCRRHEMGEGHPECPERLDAISDYLLSTRLMALLAPYDAPLATPEQLGRAHSSLYVNELFAAAPSQGYLQLDPDTAMNPSSLTAALRAAGAAVLGAELVPGARLVADALGLDEALARADVVVTGEGALDASSLRGKVVGHLAERARAAGIRLVVVAGSVRLDESQRTAAGIADAVALDAGGDPLDALMAQAGARIRAAARELGERLR